MVLFAAVIALLVMVLTQIQRVANLKQRLERVERVVLPGVPVGGTGLPPEVEFEVRSLVESRKKIQAIKIVRDHTGLGLKECKDLVERF